MINRHNIIIAILLMALMGAPSFAKQTPASDHSEAKKHSGKAKNALPPEWVNKEQARLEEITPTPVPDIPFTDENGKPHHFEEFYGKVVLLNLWATWCAPCTHEMPALSQLQKDFKRKNFKVVAISQDFKGADTVKAFYETNEISNLDIYLDQKNNLFKAFGVVGLPMSFVIDAEGNQVARIMGYVNWENEQLRDYLLSLTDQKNYNTLPTTSTSNDKTGTVTVAPSPVMPVEEKSPLADNMMVPTSHPKDPKETKMEKTIAKAEKDHKKEQAKEDTAKTEEKNTIPDKAVTLLPGSDTSNKQAASFTQELNLADPKLRRPVGGRE